MGNSRVTLSRGQINLMASYQYTTLTKHIERIVKDYNYDISTKILTGTWADNSTFNIQLMNQSGYAPVIDNIKFTIIPEPATLFLLSLGVLLIRKR